MEKKGTLATLGKDTTLEALTREAEEMSVVVLASLLSSISVKQNQRGVAAGLFFQNY